MDPLTIVVIIFMISPFVLLVLWLIALSKLKKRKTQLSEANTSLNELREKYSEPINIEEMISALRDEKQKIEVDVEELRSSFTEKRTIMSKLEAQLAIYDDRLSFAELGVYEPHFDFGDSETYKAAIKEVREQQKQMVGSKEATVSAIGWTVDGSKSKGQTMMNRQIRLTLRAFNGEADAAIANARWNNVVAMEKRILNSAKQIDAANASTNLALNDDYVALKLDELHLTHEYREQLKTEKDERAEMARLEREEKKLIAEANAAAKREEEYSIQLEKARAEVGVDASRIAELEAQLAAAHAETERAQAMAQLTSSGYVYIISNVGSFGADIVKIGLTRRLDPNDRVKELGDASVPFTFDTHAMIYSEEAPALEHALHTEFADKRVNMANFRKEFFRVGLDEVEEAVKRLAPEASFFKDREAQEWHETLAKRAETLAQLQAGSSSKEIPMQI
ncbi:DUF4041 domain-containing protein [uncultured Cohaesibacter sp.]|uniref:DUF4041 domain-containing protein n=1 Tax=uncultured Cohaesibacter sp. TaxID=1002546 RepID=UPI0029C960BF|nr:DUF4041 domain-containing protein [uncultured Cohaesibacter sp.]